MVKRLFVLAFAFTLDYAAADVKSSKVNAYSVISPPNGVSASKVNAYSVVSPPDGVSVSKVNSYGVVSPPDGVAVSKVVAYAVLKPKEKVQPSIFIFTKTFSQLYPMFAIKNSSR
ncbi:MAG: hypothetical protein NDI69_03320 [Bacteriovoracaceae bacterium]|nr:hypothetical protein [Bacteriovoracaceae bacterium]